MFFERITGFLAIASSNPKALKSLHKKAQRLLSLVEYPFVLYKGNCFVIFYITTSNKLEKYHLTNEVRIGSSFSNPLKKHGAPGLTIQITDLDNFRILTDPTGLLNIYKTSFNDAVCFSTSSLLLAVIRPDLELDEDGCLDFLTIGYFSTKQTFYKNIELIDGGLQLDINSDYLPQYRETYWWKPESIVLKKDEQNLELLKETSTSIASSIVSIVKPCCDLTGGYDSRGIVAMFLKSGNPFEAVVNGFSKNNNDVKIALLISEKLNLKLHYNDLNSFLTSIDAKDIYKVIDITDGEIDFCDYYLTWKVHLSTFNLGMATVNGTGGELFRGYWWEGQKSHGYGERKVNYNYLLKRILLPYQNLSIFFKPIEEIKSRLFDAIKRTINLCPFDGSAYSKIDWLYLKLRIGRWASRYYSSTIKILPCFSPYLFLSMLDIAFSIDYKFKSKNKLFKKWLSIMSQELARIPLDSGFTAVPFPFLSAFCFKQALVILTKKIFEKVSQRLMISKEASFDLMRIAFLTAIDENNLIKSQNMLTKGIYNESFFKIVENNDLMKTPLPINQLSRILSLEISMQRIVKLRQRLAKYENKGN